MEGEGATSHATFRDTSQLPAEPATAGVYLPTTLTSPPPQRKAQSKTGQFAPPEPHWAEGGGVTGKPTCRQGSAAKNHS